MNRFSLWRTARTCALIAAAGLAMFGCSKKLTSVDATYTAPEGRYSPNARMILFPDVAVPLYEYFDKSPIGPDPGDSLITTFNVRLTGPGVVHGLVVDSTDATTYQVLRREASGGYLPLKDFVLHPVVRWLETQWEVYRFEDPVPTSFTPSTYLGRGLVAGVLSNTSPLTNPAIVSGAPLVPIRFSGSIQPPDSLFRISWGPVAGAAGYWVQVFQYAGAPTDEIIRNGLPSPFAMGNLVDLNVAYLAAPDTLYKIGTTPVELFAKKQILVAGAYFVRIVAVDANGCMIGYSYGNAGVAVGETSYVIFPLGAFVVQPKRPSTPGPHGVVPALITGGWSDSSPLRSGIAGTR